MKGNKSIVMRFRHLFHYIILVLFCSQPGFSSSNDYPWKTDYDLNQSIAARIDPPEGFSRTKVVEHSFQQWLRNLPLKKGRPPVFLFDGTKKGNQSAHFAVVDIDTGKKDLQQCADAVIRLRAEYLFSRKKFNQIHFRFTSGDTASYLEWRKGIRPRVKGNKVTWINTGKTDGSYHGFRKYLESVFSYAGSSSLEKEMKTVPLEAMQIGDVFIQGGFPGHAVIVVDMAKNDETGETRFLLAQSYMPAQDIHVLNNPDGLFERIWYSSKIGKSLVTPEWTFSRDDLKRF